MFSGSGWRTVFHGSRELNRGLGGSVHPVVSIRRASACAFTCMGEHRSPSRGPVSLAVGGCDPSRWRRLSVLSDAACRPGTTDPFRLGTPSPKQVIGPVTASGCPYAGSWPWAELPTTGTYRIGDPPFCSQASAACRWGGPGPGSMAAVRRPCEHQMQNRWHL